jgi:hypothetical protein
MRDIYAYYDGLLAQYGYTTQSADPQPYANLQMGKWINGPFASFVMRQYPELEQSGYYRELNIFMRQPSTPNTKVEIAFLVGNGAAALAQVAPLASAALKITGLSFPPPPGTWKWAFQSVAKHRGSEIRYVSFYYEASTGRSVERALPLPLGGAIVGVFPGDCAFGARDENGHSLKFSGQDEAKGNQLAPGNWLFYPSSPSECGAVDVFLK